MPLTVQAERRLVADLFRLARERDAAERQRQADYEQRGRRAVQEFRDAQQGITKRYRADKERAERYTSLRNRAVSEADSQIVDARQVRQWAPPHRRIQIQTNPPKRVRE
jgi:hypothetical protein